MARFDVGLFMKNCFYHTGIGLMVLAVSIIFALDYSRIDDIPYHVVMEEDILAVDNMQDTDSDYDSISGGVLQVSEGEGIKRFQGEVSLTEGDSFQVSFTVDNREAEPADLCIDLYAETFGENNQFDDVYNEAQVTVQSGISSITQELPYYREAHPEKCMLRIFTSASDLTITDLRVDRIQETRDGHRLVKIAVTFMCLLAVASALYIVLGVIFRLKNRAARREKTKNPDLEREILLYVVIVTAVTLLLMFLYRNADLRRPLVYAGGDEMGVYYYGKIIPENGLSLTNPMEGGLFGADMFDYYYSDKLSFAMVWLIGRFTSNPYLTINLFYFACFYMIALISAAVCRLLKLSRPSSMLVAMCYAFSPYIQMRYPHMWLVPYFMLPLACLIAICIIQGSLFETDSGRADGRLLVRYGAIAFVCAFTGLYYAFFACALFASALMIRLIRIRGKNLSRELLPMYFLAMTVFGVLANIMPNFLYSVINGVNLNSEIAYRSGSDAEIYSLKLVQMLLPRVGHRISALAGITQRYSSTYPLVNENVTSTLGMVAGSGFILSILNLFRPKDELKPISHLNIVLFLIATIGGIGGLISVFVSLPMRCYNRMSLVIMFLSLLFLAMLIDKLKLRLPKGRFMALCVCVMMVGLFDQTADYVPNDYSGYLSASQFFDEIEQTLEPGNMVFVLPYDNWPSNTVPGSYKQHMCSIETNGIHWSYGAQQGHEEAQWQQLVANSDPVTMVDKLLYAGYDGIYFDTGLYAAKYGKEKMREDSNGITEALGYQPMVSSDGTLYFWQIGK